MKKFSNSFVYGYHEQNPRIILPFVQHLVGQPCRALEIGCYEGKFSCWWMDNVATHPRSTLRCVDPWDGHDTTIDCNATTPTTEEAHHTFLMNTQEYGFRVASYAGRSYSYFGGSLETFDFILVDGDHEAFTALRDLLDSWTALREGGILVFDDYGWHREHQPTRVKVEPRVAWDAFESLKPEGMTILHKGWQVIARKGSQ